MSGIEDDSQRSMVRTVRSLGIPIMFFKAVVRRPFVTDCTELGACWRYILVIESTVHGTPAPSHCCQDEGEASNSSMCCI